MTSWSNCSFTQRDRNHKYSLALHSFCIPWMFKTWALFPPRCWTWPRHSRMGRVLSSWCRCLGWWWSAAAQAGRDAWSHWATPSHKLSIANAPFSPLGRQRTVSWEGALFFSCPEVMTLGRGQWGRRIRASHWKPLIFVLVRKALKRKTRPMKSKMKNVLWRTCFSSLPIFQAVAEKYVSWSDWHTAVSSRDWSYMRLPW